MHLDVLHAAFRLIGRGDHAGFSGERRWILCCAGRTGRTRRPCLVDLQRLIRVPRRPRLTGLGFWPSLSALPGCA